ncbi:MAG: DUF389 domain-containing protein [Chitinophagaceae bacterium]|nr:MAG: DUF389 domain-containing protein [Chitinophagaceae bacterium]
MNTFFDKFRIHTEREEYPSVIKNIEAGVVFRGTNLWILIFAIFVASLGLNVNSPAVIIGAMLISPLMGPIMGIGLGMGINDLLTVKKALLNYVIATSVALATSTVFFLLSPLNDAHSEILARTSPNIYDVLIALFGGFAGIVATTSKQKGNVIPGVAIATALMPPLCTAGYGLATLQFTYFFGAFYLFIINTVFIALATLIIVRFSKFPVKRYQSHKAEKIAKRVTWLVVLITLLPSLYFGYDLVQQNRFTKQANLFVTNEANFPNDYLLNKKIDAKDRSIHLVYGGKQIADSEIKALEARLPNYGLSRADLQIRQGFAYLTDNTTVDQNEQVTRLSEALTIRERQQQALQARLDSIDMPVKLGRQVYQEMKIQYPGITQAVMQPAYVMTDSNSSRRVFMVWVTMKGVIGNAGRDKMREWLKLRLQQPELNLIIQ